MAIIGAIVGLDSTGGGGSGGGWNLRVVTSADSPVTAAIGDWLSTDTSSGPITVNLPDLSAISVSDEALAYVRLSDCAANWEVNAVTLVPFSGDSIDSQATDETLVLDVEAQNVQLSRSSPTNWCLDTNFQPIEAGSGSGTGTGSKNYVLSPDSATNVTSVGGATAVGTATLADLPEETKEEGVLCTITAGSIGNTSTWETDAIDDGDGGHIGSCEMYWKTKSGYVDDAASIQWYNSDTATVLRSFDIKAGTGRISNYQDSTVVLTTDENIKPRIYWNVTSETNGLVVSGAGTLAETALVGGAGGWKSYDETEVTLTDGFAGTIDSYELDLTPYKDPIKGKWRLSGNVNIQFTSATQNPVFKIDGIEVETTGITGDEFYPIPAFDGAVSASARGYVNTNTGGSANRFQGLDGNVSQANWSWGSFDIPLVGKPTWADFDGSVMLGTEAQEQAARVVYYSASGGNVTANTDLPFDTESTVLSKKGSWTNSAGSITVPEPGDYRVSYHTQYGSIASNANVNVYLDGTKSAQLDVPLSASSASSQGQAPITIADPANEKISIRFDQNITALSGGLLESWISIERIADRSSKATGFPTSNLASADAEYLVPRYQTQTVAADNDFSSGNVTCTRIGNFVQITSDTGLGHASLNTVNSSSGLIPADFRPLTTSQFNTSYHDATSAVGFEVNTAGRLQLFFRDDSGSVARTSTGIPVNISYLIV